MQALATWRRGHEILLEDGRAHSVVVDLPPEEGGASAGPTPLELTLLALAGSVTSNFVAGAHKHRLDFSSVSLAVEGSPPSASGAPGGVHGTLRVRTRAAKTDVEAVLRSALEACPVARIFRAAELPVTLDVVVASAPRVS